MMQYAWTYITSCDNNPSQNPGTSFHRFPSDRDRRARWLSVNESQLRLAVVSLFHAPSRWRCQKRTNGSLRSAPCTSVAVSVTETTAVTFEVQQSSCEEAEPGRRLSYTCGHSKSALFSFVLQPILTLHIRSLTSS